MPRFSSVVLPGMVGCSWTRFLNRSRCLMSCVVRSRCALDVPSCRPRAPATLWHGIRFGGGLLVVIKTSAIRSCGSGVCRCLRGMSEARLGCGMDGGIAFIIAGQHSWFFRSLVSVATAVVYWLGCLSVSVTLAPCNRCDQRHPLVECRKSRSFDHTFERCFYSLFCLYICLVISPSLELVPVFPASVLQFVVCGAVQMTTVVIAP